MTVAESQQRPAVDPKCRGRVPDSSSPKGEPRKWTLRGTEHLAFDRADTPIVRHGPDIEPGEQVEVWAKEDVLEVLRRPEYACIDYPDPADFLERHFSGEDGD